MKKHIPTITIFIIIIGVIALGAWYSDKDSPLKQLARLNVYSKEELSFLEEQGFLNDIDSENLPSNKEQAISLLKSSNLIEQNLNSPDESFEVLATKLDDNTYQLAFKLENKSNQSKEFYLIPISESSQAEFKEIKGVVKGGKVSWGNQGDWGYDIEKHKQELRPELAKAYDDIEKNGYTGKPIKLVLEANSTLLAQSKWEIKEIQNSKLEIQNSKLEPVYLLVYGSAGGAKDELTILTVHSSPQKGENWEVEFTTKGTNDLRIIPNDQATIDDDEFIGLFCDNQRRTPQILENDIIYYPDWQCSGTGKVIHYTKKAGKHTLKFQFGKQTAFAYNSPGLIDNLVSYWKLDEDSGDADDAHSINDGTVVGDVTQGSTGKINTGYLFGGGDDDYVVIGAMGSTQAPCSISMWVYWTGSDTTYIFDHESPRFASYLVAPNTLRFYHDGDIDIGTLTTNQWHHLVFTFNSTGYLNFYLDGDNEYDGDTNLTSSDLFSDNLFIGTHRSTTQSFDGSIDEVGIWDRALTADEVKDLYNATKGLAYNFDGVDDIVHRVVSHWKLDEGSGDALDAYDDNDGTVTNVAYGATGKIGDAYDFDGATGDVNCGTLGDAAFTESDPVTISAWINPTSIGENDFGRIVDRSATTQGPVFHLTPTNRIGFQVDGSGGGNNLTHRSDDNAITLGIFQHVVLTWDGSDSAANSHIYVNGVEVTYATTTGGANLIDNSAQDFLIGNNANDDRTFDGVIDELTVWNRVLTSTEITALYNGGDGLAYPFSISTISLKGSTMRIKGAKVRIK